MKKTSILILFIFMINFLMFSETRKVQPPDLTIINMKVNKSCNIVVVVKNKGPGLLPDFVYSNPEACVKAGPESKPIGMFDTEKKLVQPGGIAECVFNLKVSSPVLVGASVNLPDEVSEANVTNNTMKRKLGCKLRVLLRLPDLTVTDIRLVKGCKILVIIKNIGNAGVPASYYDNPDAVGVQMYNGTKPWGGMILKMFDPAGKLKSPGGVASHVWFPGAANLNLSPGIHTLNVMVDVHKKLKESNETNNELTKHVKCGAAPRIK